MYRSAHWNGLHSLLRRNSISGIDYPDLPTKKLVGNVFTGGSCVLDAFEPLRRCAAIAREFLIEAGADSLLTIVGLKMVMLLCL